MRNGDDLPHSSFTESFVRLNNLAEQEFTAWVFYPGMEFGSADTWWGDRKRRGRPHEGIDLGFYRDGAGRTVSLDIKTKVPPVYGGVVIKIMEDFLGKSIIVEHHLAGRGSERLLSIYGHTVPRVGLEPSSPVREGEAMASLAIARRSLKSPPPHLHVTLIRSLGPISHEILDWATLGDSLAAKMIDPLWVIGNRYVMQDSADMP